MAELVFKMWQETFRTFMKHDEDLIPPILQIEDKVNGLEKEITTDLVNIGRAASSEIERANVNIYTDVVGDLELIGDYCKDVLERVQIKIQENLLFSEESVKEYEILYHKTEDALSEIVRALKKDDYALIKDVLRHQEHIDSLVDEYRRRHNERLMKGICVPIACNLFINMLDFTAAIYYHTKKIARNLLKIKE
jgi:phosphate:Na+ symporter